VVAVVSAHPLMTAEEVADAFAVSVSTVKRWLRTGKLTAVTRPPDPLPRCCTAEVDAWLRGRPLSAAQVAELRDQLTGGAR
jgi:transposase